MTVNQILGKDLTPSLFSTAEGGVQMTKSSYCTRAAALCISVHNAKARVETDAIDEADCIDCGRSGEAYAVVSTARRSDRRAGRAAQRKAARRIRRNPIRCRLGGTVLK